MKTNSTITMISNPIKSVSYYLDANYKPITTILLGLVGACIVFQFILKQTYMVYNNIPQSEYFTLDTRLEHEYYKKAYEPKIKAIQNEALKSIQIERNELLNMNANNIEKAVNNALDSLKTNYMSEIERIKKSNNNNSYVVSSSYKMIQNHNSIEQEPYLKSFQTQKKVEVDSIINQGIYSKIENDSILYYLIFKNENNNVILKNSEILLYKLPKGEHQIKIK